MKKQVIVGLLLLMLLIFLNINSMGQQVRAQLDLSQDYAPNEILIRYKNNIVIEDELAVKELAIWGGTEEPEIVERVIPGKELYALKFDENINIKQVVGEYNLIEEVEYAEPNYILHTFDNSLFVNNIGNVIGKESVEVMLARELGGLIINNINSNNNLQEELSQSSVSLNILGVNNVYNKDNNGNIGNYLQEEQKGQRAQELYGLTVNNKITNNNFQPFLTPNDSDYSLQWGLPNINAEQAWNLTIGNSSIVIAIIDTGVDWDHPDLAGNIWNNTDEDCSNSTDDDGNGYVDDCRGYDFVNVTSGCDSNDDCEDEDNNPMDFQGHGTHCAGIAGAVSNNNVGVAGVCWNCTIMPIRAGYKSASGQGSLAVIDVVQALNYATDNNATIISMSFGGSHSASIDEAINESYGNGSILIASAGNDGANSKQYPCAYDKVICVGATNSDNTSWSSSNYGSWLDLAAPGSSIRSTYYNDTYTSLSGTSMATPMVAGAIGLIVGLFNQNQTQVKNTLNNTGSLVNFTNYMIAKIDIYSALLSLDNTPPNVSLISPAHNHLNLTANQTFSCNASDWQLSNITFEIWNSTGNKVYNETGEISGIFNVSSFNVINLNQDTYEWNCLSYDAESNFAYASSNFTLIIGGIETILTSPINNTYTTVNNTNFTCQSLSENTYELTNVSFYLWNYTGILLYNQSQQITGFDNSTVFNYTFQNEIKYFWNCLTFNNITNFSWADNFTITYDIANPNIILLNPADGSSYTSNSQSIDFGYNASDNFEIANCSLIINDVINLINNSISSVENNFTQTFSPGTYTWEINCSDKANNKINSSSRSFTITSIPITTASGGGGGGTLAKTYIPSSQQVLEGYTKSLNEKDKIKFFDKQQEPHLLTVKEVSVNYVILTIESDPITLKLGIGQSAKLNLTSSDYYDLYVKLNSIENSEAELTIQTIKEAIPKSKVIGESVIDTIVEEPKSEEPKEEITKLKTIIYILVIIVIIIIILFLFLEKRHLKNLIKIKEKIKK